MKIRVGFGYDVHRLSEGETLNLGGIVVPYSKGTVGHSDADVLIHAICDALLGAASLRDIGFHFPDTSEKYKGIDSKVLLKDTVCLLNEKGWSIGNVDATIALQRPKIKEYIPKMMSVLAETMNIPSDDVAVKATTTEELGFVGAGDGVAVYAVVLIQKS